MPTWHIHIEGQVQGVGFRPFVFALAQKYGLFGWVNNTVDGVHVVFNADPAMATTFREQLVAQAPRLSQITAIQLEETTPAFFDNFQIIHSGASGTPRLLLTPDFAMCSDCRTELHSPKDQRYSYPFITCTNCGPRFSIVHGLPYDRAQTTMDAFPMCATCQSEYDDPKDRRYYSQTNSCLDCGIQMALYDAEGQILMRDTAPTIDRVVQAWQNHQIVAIKGIGGYLLTCAADSPIAVAELRRRKHRPSKPLALMYPSAAALENFALDPEMMALLQGPVAPIVLVDMPKSNLLLPEIAPGLDQVGIMLPYTPLYDLLLQKFGKAIVATSGNISQSPIVFRDQKALDELSKIADLILVNNREIVLPQDDSVIKYSFFKKQKITIRRSRGLAPTYINPDLKWPSKNILAMGGMLKSTFSLLCQNNIYVSQYLGDLDHFDTQQNYQEVIQHFLSLFQIEPDVILSDKHADYPSTRLGELLSEKFNVTRKKIQHHKAHFGAILGEHQLIHSEAPVLGVIWDGTGLGDDGQIWGGEFFKYEQYEFLRANHFSYFDFILGNKMPKEPRISALTASWNVLRAERLLRDKFSDTELKIYSKLLDKKDNLKTSSVGRLFDAVASLIGLVDQQSYEGEAAMRLETLATDYFKKHGLAFSESYFTPNPDDQNICVKSLIDRIALDLQKGVPHDYVAAKFHFSLVQIIEKIATDLKIEKIAFSGGVFQNGLLVDLIQHYLSDSFELFFHKDLSPNDENISFGQLVCYQIENHKVFHLKNKSETHVFSNSR